MSAETVTALWVGPFEVALPDGRRLAPGIDKHELGRDEAEASDYWQVQTPAKTNGTGKAAPSPAQTPGPAGEED